MPIDSQTPKTYIYTRFQGNYEKEVRKNKISRQVAAILIIGGKLKIWSGDIHTHG